MAAVPYRLDLVDQLAQPERDRHLVAAEQVGFGDTDRRHDDRTIRQGVDQQPAGHGADRAVEAELADKADGRESFRRHVLRGEEHAEDIVVSDSRVVGLRTRRFRVSVSIARRSKWAGPRGA